MARIYANENFPGTVVARLSKLGHDVLTTHQAGRSNQQIPDEEVLEFASLEQRIVLTFNRKDFIKLHKKHAEHSGIVACTEDANFEALANRIHDVIEHFGGNLNCQLARVNRPNAIP